MEMLTNPNSCHLSPFIPNGALDLCVRKRSPSPDTYIDLRYDNFRTSSDSEMSENCTTASESAKSPTSSYSRLKATRPFKAYPKDPVSLVFGTVAPESSIIKNSSEAFNEFRQRVLSQVQTTNTGTNKNMRRVTSSTNGLGRNEDPGYWEKRRKNNEAAKRSRDARRAKEDEIAIRCAFLEQENMQLRMRLAALESEKLGLQEIVYRNC